MGEFLFKVDKKAQVCITAGDGFYQIQRKMEDGYANLAIDGKVLQVNARSNLCVIIPFAGEYRIIWPAPINCASSKDPIFEVTELDQRIDLVPASFRNNLDDLYFAGWVKVTNLDLKNTEWFKELDGSSLDKPAHTLIEFGS
ncbi:MAG: hypothetical protein E6Q83_03525 [Thiothrix sp.]|nr:MAG: hypothetical protein E6Q83_03525 [Thiothrix sp.]